MSSQPDHRINGEVLFSTKKVITHLLLVLPITGVLFYLILQSTDHSFTYTLDDAYIHLELAKNIYHGNYGINMNEPSAPCSSILYPLLLVPFAALGRYFEYVPLIVNVICLFFLSYTLDYMFRNLNLAKRLILSFFIIFSLNAFGVVFTGMEHNMHLVLVALSLLPFVGPKTSQENTKIYTISAVAIVLAPLVRYEGLAISLPLIAYIFFNHNKKLGVTLFLALMVPLVGFSMYLYSKGLGFTPASVTSKSVHGSFESIYMNLYYNIYNYGFLLFPLAIVLFYSFTKDKFWVLFILSATGLHFLFGKIGWFGRYELYYLLFAVLILYNFLLNIDIRLAYFSIFLAATFPNLVSIVFKTPMAASNVYNQHKQMSDIVLMLDAPVAVNDLGMVAYNSENYVLDVFGLGSLEALENRVTKKGQHKWLVDLTEEYNVQYILIYEDLFTIPPGWIPVGELRLKQKCITPARDNVDMFATDSIAAAKFKNTLNLFKEQNASDNFEVAVY